LVAAADPASLATSEFAGMEPSRPKIHMPEAGKPPESARESSRGPVAQTATTTADRGAVQSMHLGSILKMKTEEVERLQAKVRSLIRTQTEQAAQLVKIFEERMEME
jgi:hypothetical protein